MSESEGPDAVEEVAARAELPRTYRGSFRGEDVRVLGYVGNDGPTLETQIVWYEDPDDNPVPEERYAVPVGSAVQLLDALESFAEGYGLREEPEGGEQA